MKKIITITLLMFTMVSNAYAMTVEQAKSANKPMVVMFHMKGCHACKRFSPIFDKFSSQFSNKFNFVKEDAYSPLANSLNFMTVPAIFIIQPKTMESKRIDDACAWDNKCFAKTLQDY